jgi:hypothetical protein
MGDVPSKLVELDPCSDAFDVDVVAVKLTDAGRDSSSARSRLLLCLFDESSGCIFNWCNVQIGLL